jgi:hypothetical protein
MIANGGLLVRAPIDRDELAHQLRKLREREALADEGRLAREAPLLLTLTGRLLDREGAAEHALTPRALQLVEDAVHHFSPDSQRLLHAGLNLGRTSGTTLESRLRELAEELYYADGRHLADRERGLYAPLADYLLEEVDLVRTRRAHEALARGDGDQNAAALFVAEQFRYYYRVFTPMGAVGADLNAYLIYRHRDPNPDHRPTELIDAALYRYAQWQLAIERFVRDLGGNWIASTPDTEADLVAALDTAQRRLPFGDRDDSLLRLSLLDAPHGERVTFERHLRSGNLYYRFHRRLKRWVERCDCNPRRPKRACEPHQVIRATRQFTILVDQEWYRLAKWYELPPDTVSAERDDVLHYFLHADPENYDLGRLDYP